MEHPGFDAGRQGQGRGTAWGDYNGRLACGGAGFYRNACRASLVPRWLPALDRVVEKLERGALVADGGCGHGHSSLLIAEAFARSRVDGFDTHALSIAEAQGLALVAAEGTAKFEVTRSDIDLQPDLPLSLLLDPH